MTRPSAGITPPDITVTTESATVLDQHRFDERDRKNKPTPAICTRRCPCMRVKLQRVICDDQGQQETITDVITLNKSHQRIEQLGLTLADAKHLLNTLQRHLLHRQVDAFLGSCSTCPDCGTPLKVKAYPSRSFRALFGTFKLESPRLEHWPCMPRKTSSFRPLSALLTESVAPELLYMEAKWSSLVSYGMSLDALEDFLPLDIALLFSQLIQ